jgi:hypothetical protein
MIVLINFIFLFLMVDEHHNISSMPECKMGDKYITKHFTHVVLQIPWLIQKENGPEK